MGIFGYGSNYGHSYSSSSNYRPGGYYAPMYGTGTPQSAGHAASEGAKKIRTEEVIAHCRKVDGKKC